MPPSGKRKRPERGASYEEGQGRPSPHRPENLHMAHHGERGRDRGRGAGGRRQSRQGPQSPDGAANSSPAATRRPVSPQQARSSAAMDNSRSSTPAVRNATPVQMKQQYPVPDGQGQKKASAPYVYEYVLDERVAAWQESGKGAVLEVSQEGDFVTASTIIQELLRSALDGRLEPSQAGATIAAMVQQQPDGQAEVQETFLDAISLLPPGDTNFSALARLVAATNIDPDMIRAELDTELLVSLGLVRNTFGRVKARKTTVMLYKQANFNLLREESEGYAKLITEYFNTAQQATRGLDPNMAESAFQRIMALVGAFDLDVGRVLDITLDVSANSLVRAYPFFLKFYRCSSWWPAGGDDTGGLNLEVVQDEGYRSIPLWAEPNSGRWDTAEGKEQHALELAQTRETRDRIFWDRVRDVGMDAFFEIGARRIVDYENVKSQLEQELPPEIDGKGQESNADKRKRLNESRKYMLMTKRLPPPGNSDAAQLFGFKLRFYASPARDVSDVLLDNVVAFAALLIKIGFISLRDLYPHLYPPDEAMESERERLQTEKNERERKQRPGGGANALANAGALADDTVPAVRNLRTTDNKSSSGASTPKPETEADKEELPAPPNQKIMLLKALLLIGAIPEALYILGRFPWLVEVDSALPPYLHRIMSFMLDQIGETLRPLDETGVIEGKPLIMDTIALADGTLPATLRPHRKTMRWLYADNPDENNAFYFSDWSDNIPMCQTVDDVFLLCNTFLTFSGVKIGQDNLLYTRLVRLAKRSLETDVSESNRTRWLDLTKRLLVPALSLTKHNPGITHEVYELLMFFPTSTRFNIYAEWYTGRTSRSPDIQSAFTRNKYEVKDVLRRVTNESGKKQARALAKVCLSSPGIVMRMVIEQLESYSNMIPSLVECTRYFSLLSYDVLTWCLINALSGQGRDTRQADGMLTSPWLQALSNFVASMFTRHGIVNIGPVLQYIASELRKGNSNDLEVFEQILGEMAGIRAEIAFNDAQVLAMAGGDVLQLQTVKQMGDTRISRQKEAKRLIKALVEGGLIGQILIAIAQERMMYAHKDDNKWMPLKVLGSNLDKIQQIFAQFLEVLKANLEPAKFEEAVPDALELVGEFGLQPAIALTVCRHALAYRIGEFDAERKKEEQEEKKRRSSQGKEGAADTEILKDADESHDMLKAETSTLEDERRTPAAIEEKSPWHPVLEPIIDGLALVSPELSEKTSMAFFVTFWTLTQSDVLVHTDSYDNEMKRLNKQIGDFNNTRTDATAVAIKEREKKKKALVEIVDQLNQEMKGQIAGYTKTRNRLTSEKSHWFERNMERDVVDKRHLGLLQECFLPRALISAMDANYCFLMLKLLHSGGTPGFSIMHLLNHLFKKQLLAALMYQCTMNEAQNLGRFLCEILRLLQHWHSEKATYEKEAFGSKKQLPGFAKKLDAKGHPETLLDYEEFRRLMFNWHTALNGAFKSCFDSGEYMHTRNGIVVLRAVVQVFPVINFMGKDMLNHVEKMSKEESRQDLKLAATSLMGPLKQREKAWIMVQAFRLNDASKDGKITTNGSASRAGSAVPETPKLSATAPEFRPKPEPQTNGQRKESVAGQEEGEIEDVKVSDAPQQAEASKEVVDRTVLPQPSSTDTALAKDENKENGPPESKGATPAQTQSKPGTPAPPSIPSKPPPKDAAGNRPAALPAKPDIPPVRGSARDRPETRLDGRYGGRQNDSYGRLDRPGEIAARERSPGRSRVRTPEQDPYYGAGPQGRPPLRDDRQPLRPPHSERPARDGTRGGGRREVGPPATMQNRASPADLRSRPNSSMGPPPAAAPSAEPHPDRAGYLTSLPPSTAAQHSARNPSSEPRIAETASNSASGVNPARAALIEEALQKEDHRSRPSRPQEQRPNGDVARPDAAGDRFRDAGTGPRHIREEPSDHAPTGPRGGRHGQQPSRDEPYSAGPHSRPPQGRGAADPSNGRIPRDMGPPSVPQDPNYGRLNGPTDGPPSGPRQPNGASSRSGRTYPAPAQPPLSTRSAEPSPSPVGARPPDSPASFRSSRNARQEPDPPLERQQPASSAGSVPASESNVMPGMHPSRAAQISATPPPIQTNVPPAGAQSGASPTTAPPSGPRGNNRAPANTPTGPSPSNGIPPSGPATERGRRDRQRSSINSTLQSSTAASVPQAPNVPNTTAQGVSFRGASSRQGSVTMPPSSIAEQAPVVASPIDSQRREMPQRQDGYFTQPESRADQVARYDDPVNRGGSRPRYPEDDRPGSHRGSRHPSKERRPEDEPHRRPPLPPQAMDDMRGPPRGQRDDRPPARGDFRGPPGPMPQRDSRPRRGDEGPTQRPYPPPNMSSAVAGPMDFGGDNRMPRGPEDGRRPLRGGEMRGGRPDDGRRDGPPDGRKRRHDEGGFDPTKRRRSGR